MNDKTPYKPDQNRSNNRSDKSHGHKNDRFDKNRSERNGPSRGGPNRGGPKDGSRGGSRKDAPQLDETVREPTIYSDNPKGIAVRRAACDLLTLVRDGMPLDEALSAGRSYQGLSRSESGDKDPATVRADKGFARAIATTVLRRKGTLDHLIGPYLDRPLPAKAMRIMDILRVSAAQTLFLETPPHAAVSLATELSKERKELAGYANLVNAVARKLSATPPEKIAGLPLRTDTPAWMWRAWERHYGAANARKIAIAHQKQAPLDLSLRNPEERAMFEEALAPVDFDYNKALPSLRIAPAPSNVTKLDGFKEGQFWVQDIAASLPVTLLGDIKGQNILDLCAAPGGKTLQLAAAGANVTAIDRSDERLDRLRANLARTNLEAKVLVADAVNFQSEDKADIILLDAPCSATGTIRRHPDIPWTKTQTDVDALVVLQARMIDNAITLLKPGGTLLYCTCSLQPEEGEKQIETALKRHEHITRKGFSPEQDPCLNGPFQKAINRHGDLRLLPFMGTETGGPELSGSEIGGPKPGGMDGFFIARLQKIA